MLLRVSAPPDAARRRRESLPRAIRDGKCSVIRRSAARPLFRPTAACGLTGVTETRRWVRAGFGNSAGPGDSRVLPGDSRVWPHRSQGGTETRRVGSWRLRHRGGPGRQPASSSGRQPRVASQELRRNGGTEVVELTAVRRGVFSAADDSAAVARACRVAEASKIPPPWLRFSFEATRSCRPGVPGCRSQQDPTSVAPSLRNSCEATRSCRPRLPRCRSQHEPTLRASVSPLLL